MVKFIAGPILGAKWELSIFTTALFTILGACFSVIVFTYIGGGFRSYLIERRKKRNKKKKVFTKKKRSLINIYKKFGIRGVAFFTPLFLTPIGGTIVALSFGVPRKKIISNMIPSIILWGIIISAITILFWKELAWLINKPVE